MPPPSLTGPKDGHWQLFNVKSDRAETTDLSKDKPLVLNDLIQKWNDYLKRVGGIVAKRPGG